METNTKVIPAGTTHLNTVPAPKKMSQDRVMFEALNSAIALGADPVALEKMLDMQIRILDRQNEQAFNKAMTKAQKAMPSVVANADNDQTNSKYPKLERITQVCAPIYFKNGFNCSFDTGDGAPEGEVRVRCYVAHSGGHTREYHVDIPIDNLGPKGAPVKTLTHGKISAVTYGQSRLMRMIWNVRVVNDVEDDDGVLAGRKPIAMITEAQAADLRSFLEEVKVPESEFLKRKKIADLESLPATMLPLALSELERRRKKMGGAGS